MGVTSQVTKELMVHSPISLLSNPRFRSVSALLACESWPLVAFIFPRYARNALPRELIVKNVRKELRKCHGSKDAIAIKPFSSLVSDHPFHWVRRSIDVGECLASL